ncbi:hypothetical protein EJB05_31587 [Eragrostis curvula]|uniref:Factor of DNA methylation 1-5/IDN2 domain-containing protein n=1 Tax=Eragrostis curvula TaxID=38414 RepID=A0A5J9UEG4_9POAL|nr:hypothetical protein EJB05_31587 [Eragrostis curvula]
MVLAGEGDETGSPGHTSGCCGVTPGGAGQNLGIEAGSRKRKAAVLSRDFNNFAGSGGLEVQCEASRRISMEVENLRSQMDEDVKDLGYFEENAKLRTGMDLKDKELQCLRKQNEKLQPNYENQNDELQSNYEKLNEASQAKFKKLNEEPQAKHEKQKEGVLANYEKQNEEVQARNVGLHKNTVCTLENQIDAKKKQLRQLEGWYSIMEFSLAQLKELKEIPDKSCDEGTCKACPKMQLQKMKTGRVGFSGHDPNSKLVDQSFPEKSGVGGKADDETLKKQKLEKEVAKLDAEIKMKMDKLYELLDGEKLLEELGSTTVWKSNIELQDIRRELIGGLEDNVLRFVDIKMMGAIEDVRILRAACQQRYGTDEADVRAAMLTSSLNWDLTNPSWHPFKIVDANGRLKEVVDDDDAKLKYLRAEYGDDVCNIVTTALNEMNEFNPSGRYPVPGVWNFREGRKATGMEAIRCLLMLLREMRRKLRQYMVSSGAMYIWKIETEMRDANLDDEMSRISLELARILVLMQEVKRGKQQYCPEILTNCLRTEERISMAIENLRSHLDECVTELGYCEENEKLRAEMDLKDKEMQCLRKQNEELQAKYEKQNEELQAKYEKQNEELQAKYEMMNQELQAKYEKQNEDLQSKCKKQKEELQAKYEKQNEEVQAKNMGLHKNIACTLEKQLDAKKKQLRQLEGLYSTMEFSLAQLEQCKEIPDRSCDEDPNSKLVDQSSAEISGGGKADDETLKKQKLEIEVAKLDAEIEIKMNKLHELLEDEKLIEELGSATVWKSIQANNELQEIRRELIVGLEDNVRGLWSVGIKRMGEIEGERILRAACQQRYGNDGVDYGTAMLEVVDDDDARLKYLRAEYGDDVCNVVTTALIEMNEYNPSGRFPVPEFWNFREGRKATMKEVLKYLLRKLPDMHRRRRHNVV